MAENMGLEDEVLLEESNWGEPERAPHKCETAIFSLLLYIMVRWTTVLKRMRHCVNLE